MSDRRGGEGRWCEKHNTTCTRHIPTVAWERVVWMPRVARSFPLVLILVENHSQERACSVEVH